LAHRRSASRQALALLANLAVWLQQWQAASDVAKGHCHTRGAVAHAAEHGVRRARPRGTPDLDAVPARSGAAGRGSPSNAGPPFSPSRDRRAGADRWSWRRSTPRATPGISERRSPRRRHGRHGPAPARRESATRAPTSMPPFSITLPNGQVATVHGERLVIARVVGRRVALNEREFSFFRRPGRGTPPVAPLGPRARARAMDAGN